MRIAELSALKNSHVIWWMGQSNANGLSNAGGVYPASPPDTATYNPKKGQLIYNNISAKWEYLQQNKNNSGTPDTQPYTTGYIGAEMVFMQLMYDYYQTDQYLIKYALGGTSLATDTAAPINWNPYTGDALMFKGAVDNYFAAINSLPFKLKPDIIIWDQGENDTALIDANDYQDNCTEFFDELINQCNLPDVKFIQVGLSDNQTYYPNKDIVNAAKINMAVRGNKFINTDGFEIATDHIHYSVNGYSSLGTALYDTAITML